MTLDTLLQPPWLIIILAGIGMLFYRVMSDGRSKPIAATRPTGNLSGALLTAIDDHGLAAEKEQAAKLLAEVFAKIQRPPTSSADPKATL